MADCNKTVDFLRTLNRCCNAQFCSDCPICPPSGVNCIARAGSTGLERAEDIIPPLQRWADAHPVETWLERLQRALPECDLTYIIRPLCPGSFFAAAPGRHNCPYDGSPQRPDCFSCWRQEATDEL